MGTDNALRWFEALVQRGRAIPIYKQQFGSYPEKDLFHAWATEAACAVAQTFPEGHPVRVAWEKDSKLAWGHGGKAYFLRALVGDLEGAANIIRDGRLASIIEGVRAETVGELLDHAEDLLGRDYLAAATVIAGGALETHLKHLCDRHALEINGHGSISDYDSAIGRARKAGTSVYSKGDSKQIIAWGDTRNAAAHKPAEFDRTRDEVRLMIEGIRQFLARTAG